MAIQVTFLEQDGQRPEDLAAMLAQFLAAARTSLHIAIYDFHLSNRVAAPIVQGLRERAAAGVEVRIAYDAGKPGPLLPSAGADPNSGGTADFIARIGQGVQAKPISGGDPHMPKLMHHKYVVRDGRTPAAAVWTGSSNFTDDSWRLEENNILRIDSPILCGYYETDFAELWARGDIATTGLGDRGAMVLDGKKLEVAFSPGDGAAIDHDVAHRIGAARQRLKVCSMLVTSGAILGALADSLHHGLIRDYGGIYDRTQMESVFQQWQDSPAKWKIAAFEQVSAGLAGKRSTPYTPQSRHDFMHNKILVVDDTVITGSYNLSRSATENAENVLFIQDADLAAQYSAYIDHLVKRYGDH